MNTTATLGLPIPHDDESYTGEVSTSPVSMDYFRAKFLEFQQAMNALDTAYQAGTAAYFASDPPDEEIYALLLDYEQNAAQIKGIAETLNMGANLVNSMGGRMPSLSVPQSLGFLPALTLPAAIVGAIAAVATWMTYSLGYVRGMKAAIDRIIQSVPEAQRPALVAALSQTAEAERQLVSNPLSSVGAAFGGVAGLVKVAVVGFLGYMAWKSFNDVMDR